jgi:hypothetical protein
MDEERLLRDVLAQPEAPHPDTVADARARLDRLTRTEGRRTNAARLAATALVAAVGVVGASLVPQLIPARDDKPEIAPARSASAPAPTPAASPAELPAADELLGKAATYEAQRSTPAGTFWRLRTLSTSDVVVEAKTPYTMQLRAVTERWAGTNAYAPSGILALSMRPASPADVRAHAQNGSPAKVLVRLSDGPKPTPLLGIAVPDKGRLLDETVVHLGPAAFTGNYLQKLPTQPKALVNALLTVRDPDTKTDPDGWLFATLSELLVDTPAKPAVRSTALKAMIDLPGIDEVGLAADVYGRTGVALERDGLQLLLDPKTGAVLGIQRDNGPRIAVLDAAWTDDKPTPPAAPGD